MSEDFNLGQKALGLIKGRDLVQKVLSHLHPTADTWLTSGINSDNKLQVGVAYGAKQELLYTGEDAGCVLDIMNSLQGYGVLERVQDNYFGTRWALPGEWKVIDDSPARFNRNYQLREELHKAIGSKLPKEYSIGD